MSDTIRVVFKSGREGGSGSLLCPPGHPNLTYSVWTFPSPYSRNPDAIMSVEAAAETDWLPESARRRARDLLDAFSPGEPSELWVRNVYGYFAHMYVPDSGSRHASDLVLDSANTYPAERHAAVALVREYFPGHEPRTDLIADSSYCYGAYPCVKCGSKVQYSARLDAFAVFDEATADCPQGGRHQWPEREQ